jgi:hypothetical protein
VAALVKNITVDVFVTRITGVDFQASKVTNVAVFTLAAMVTKLTVVY